MTHLKPAKEENWTTFTKEKFKNLSSTERGCFCQGLFSSLTFCWVACVFIIRSKILILRLSFSPGAGNFITNWSFWKLQAALSLRLKILGIFSNSLCQSFLFSWIPWQFLYSSLLSFVPGPLLCLCSTVKCQMVIYSAKCTTLNYPNKLLAPVLYNFSHLCCNFSKSKDVKSLQPWCCSSGSCY